MTNREGDKVVWKRVGFTDVSELAEEMRTRQRSHKNKDSDDPSLCEAGAEGFRYDPENFARARRYGFHPPVIRLKSRKKDQ